MKRSIDCNQIMGNVFDENTEIPSKIVKLVERNERPLDVPLVNPLAIAKKSYTEAMDLSEGFSQAESFTSANVRNKLDVIGRQMKNLQELMTDVLIETKTNHELHSVACNFVKKPGHVYHLYERSSGQRYFGMISPEEWQKPPHQYLGSYRLEADQSWTPAGQEAFRYEGLTYLRDMFSGGTVSGMRSLINSSSD